MRERDVLLQKGRWGAGGDSPNLFSVGRKYGVTVAGDAAIGHFEAGELAFGAAPGSYGFERIAADEVALVELGVALQAGLEDVDLIRDLMAVQGHGGLEAQGVARTKATGEDAELLAGFQHLVPDAL